VKTKPHHPIKGKDKGGDQQVVHEHGGGIFLIAMRY